MSKLITALGARRCQGGQVGSAASLEQPRRLAAGLWAVAAVLWALVWYHGIRSHGPTTANEMRLWLGLTWMDSAKLLAAPLAVVVLAINLQGRRAKFSRASLRVVWSVLQAAVCLQVIMLVTLLWAFPWGSYEQTFEALGPTVLAGPVYAGATLAATALAVPFAVALCRTGQLPVWAAPAFVIGMFTTFYPTPPTWIPALMWGLTAVGVAWSGKVRSSLRRARPAMDRGNRQQTDA